VLYRKLLLCVCAWHVVSFSRQSEHLQCRREVLPVIGTSHSWSRIANRFGRADDRCVRKLVLLETTVSMRFQHLCICQFELHIIIIILDFSPSVVKIPRLKT